ncbi:MAG: hypothetical protein L0206_08370, partial [Actinobacteria bacterium]|nr:hypothetical protein [Actinomycetota bacterium]
AIDLGSMTDTAVNTLELSDAELDTVVAGTALRVGDALAGAMTISAPIDPLGTSRLHLITGAGIASAAPTNTITETELALEAGGTIDVATVVTKLAAQTPAGPITVANTGSLTLGTVDGLSGVRIVGGTSASIEVAASSPLTVSAPVTNSSGGDISLAALGSAATDDLTVNDDVTATGGTGAIRLYAGDTLRVGASATVSAASTGLVRMAAGTDVSTGSEVATGTGDLTLVPGSVVQSEGGMITLRAPGNVGLSLVDADAAIPGLDGTVTVDAGDSIGDGVGGPAVVAGALGMRAGKGIGSGTNVLETQVATLAAETQTGPIRLENTGPLTLDTVTVEGTVVDGVAVLGGGPAQIEVGATSPLTVNEPVVNASGGAITLAALGNATTDDLTIDADVTTTGGAGAINLYAGHTIRVGTNATVSAAGTGSVLVSAGTDVTGGTEANGSGTGGVILADGTALASQDGGIALRAPGRIALSLVDADSDRADEAATPDPRDDVAGTVTVVADFEGVSKGLSDGIGTIEESGSDSKAEVVAGSLGMRAGDGIGSGANALETQVVTLAAETQTGSIEVVNNGAFAIGTVTVEGTAIMGVNAPNGSITLDATDSTLTGGTVVHGTIGFDGVETMVAGQSILLNTKDEPMTIPPAATIFRSQAGDLTLTATGGDIVIGHCPAPCDPGAEPTTAFGSGEKLTVPGHLTLNANTTAGVVRTGDFSAMDASVSASKIVLVRRESGEVVLSDGSAIEDGGVDIVANTITLSTPAIAVGKVGGVTFATASGAPVENAPADSFFPSGQPIASSDFFSGDTVLDLTSEGTIDAGSLGVQPVVLEETTIRPGGLRRLNEVGAQEKPLWASEVQSFLQCSLFEDVEREEVPEECQQYLPGATGELADPRLQTEPAQVAQEAFQSLYQEVNDTRDTLQRAADDWRARTPPSELSGRGFRAFVAQDPRHRDALGYLDRFAELFRNIEKLAGDETAAAELGEWRALLIDDVTPNGMSPAELEEAIEASTSETASRASDWLVASDDLPRSLR